MASYIYRSPIRVPRYLVPVAKKVREIEKIMDKGVIIDSPTVKAQKQTDGRVQLKLSRGGLWE